MKKLKKIAILIAALWFLLAALVTTGWLAYAMTFVSFSIYGYYSKRTIPAIMPGPIRNELTSLSKCNIT